METLIIGILPYRSISHPRHQHSRHTVGHQSYLCLFLRFYKPRNNCWIHYDRRIWLRSDSRYHMVHEVENRRQAVAA